MEFDSNLKQNIPKLLQVCIQVYHPHVGLLVLSELLAPSFEGFSSLT